MPIARPAPSPAPLASGSTGAARATGAGALSTAALLVGCLVVTAGGGCRSEVGGGTPNQPGPRRPAPSIEPPGDAPTAVEPTSIPARARGQLGPGRGVVLIDLEPPAGAKLNQEAPLSAVGSGGIGLSFPERLRGPLGEHELPLRLPVDVQDGATGPAEVALSYYWCEDGNQAACRRETARLRLELDLTGDAPGGEAYASYRTRPQ